MYNKEFNKQLDLQTRKYAAINMKRSAALPDTPKRRDAICQITKPGSSIGANYKEAEELLAIFTSVSYRNRIKNLKSR